MPIWPFRRKSSRQRSRSGATSSDADDQANKSQIEKAQKRESSTKKPKADLMKPKRASTKRRSFPSGQEDLVRVDRTVLVGRVKAPYGPPTKEVALGHSNTAAEGPWDRTPTLHPREQSNRPSQRRSSRRLRQTDLDREAEIKAMSRVMPARPATEILDTPASPTKDIATPQSRRAVKTWGPTASDISLPPPTSAESILSSDSDFAAFKVSAIDALAPRPTLYHAPGSRWTVSRHAGSSDPQPMRGVRQRLSIPEDAMHARKRIDDLAEEMDAAVLRELMERDNRRRERKRERDKEKMQERLAKRAEKQRADDITHQTSGTERPKNLERGVLGRELAGLGPEPDSAVVTSSKKIEPDISKFAGDLDEQPPQRPEDIYREAVQLRAHEPPEAQEVLRPQEEVQAGVLTDTFAVTDLPLDAPHSVSGDGQEQLTMPLGAIQPTPLEPVEEPEIAHVPTMSTDVPSEEPTVAAAISHLQHQKPGSRSTFGIGMDGGSVASPSIDTQAETGNASPLPVESDLRRSRSKRFSLSKLLRRSQRAPQKPDKASSFSNTSREEMQAAAVASGRSSAFAQAEALAKLQGDDPPIIPPQSYAGNYLARSSSSSIPKRTQSRFREDLPEYAASGTDSRTISPTDAPMPLVPELEAVGTDKLASPREVPIANNANMFPTDDEPSRARGLSFTQASSIRDPHQSISLASVDSEASWLSGRANTQRDSTVRDSIAQSSLQEPVHGNPSDANSIQEDLAIVDDEYLSRLTPGGRDQSGNRLGGPSASEEILPSSDEEEFLEETELKWGAVGLRPRMVQTHRHDRDTVQSREGLLNMVADHDGPARESDGEGSNYGDDGDEDLASPLSYKDDTTALHRATSVNVGKGHARNFSAGSAKLLDISPRASMDDKALRQQRRRSEPMEILLRHHRSQ